MTVTDIIVKKIIVKLLNGLDYRIEVVTLIDAVTLQFAIDFFKKVIEAKLKSETITADWYRRELLSDDLATDEIIINSGLNKKTISNMYNTTTREIAIDASRIHYDTLYQAIKSLVESNDEVNITLTLKFKGVSVELDINESLIVINTIGVKRAAISGGAWSTAGKQVEKPLMKTLCLLFQVPEAHYNQTRHLKPARRKALNTVDREVDFFLFGKSPEEKFKCEVKLMGKGNPESADGAFARKAKVFIADKLSEMNKQQATDEGIEWVELREANGYKRFTTVLKNLGIPYTPFDGDTDELNRRLDEIFKIIFSS